MTKKLINTIGIIYNNVEKIQPFLLLVFFKVEKPKVENI